MDNYIGEIKAFPYNYVPQGWLPCDGGQVLITAQQALYAVISNKYGGDGRTYFNLPDLRGVVPMGSTAGSVNSVNVGQTGGEEGITLTNNQMPAHNHNIQAEIFSHTSSPITQLVSQPGAGVYLTNAASYITSGSNTTVTNIFTYAQSAAAPQTTLNPVVVSVAGPQVTVAHENRMPFLPMNFGICVEGAYPPHQN